MHRCEVGGVAVNCFWEQSANLGGGYPSYDYDAYGGAHGGMSGMGGNSLVQLAGNLQQIRPVVWFGPLPFLLRIFLAILLSCACAW